MANAFYKGDETTLGWRLETTFDETPTATGMTKWLGIVPNMDVDVLVNYVDHRTMNNDRDLYLESSGKVDVTGSIPIDLQNGNIIALAMGAEALTGTAAGYTHTITGTKTIPSICIEASYDGTNKFMRYFRGTKINTLSIEAAEGAGVKATAGFIGVRGVVATGAQSTITHVTTQPFMFHHGLVTINGYASYDITSFKWSIDNKCVPKTTIRQTDGQYAKVIIEGGRDYEITANVLLPDDSTYGDELYSMMLAGSKFTTLIDLTRVASTDDLVLTASNCTIRAAPHNFPESGEAVEVPITIKPRVCGWVEHNLTGTYLV